MHNFKLRELLSFTKVIWQLVSKNVKIDAWGIYDNEHDKQENAIAVIWHP